MWFSEPLPAEKLDLAISLTAKSDVFISIGTSGVVQPAASLPIIAGQNNSTLIEINTNPTKLSHLMDYVFQGQAGKLLPNLIDQL